MAVNQKYVDEANDTYSGQYDNKRRALENALNSSISNLNVSKGGINSAYDGQVKNQNLQNTLGKNNFSNSMLGRGLGRSTIATSGLAGLDTTNARVVNDINTNRTSALSNVDTSIADLKNSHQNNLIGLDSEKMSAVNQLARELQNRYEDNTFRDTQAQWQKDYQNAQLQLQREQMANDQAYKYASLNKSSGTSSSTKDSPNDLYASFMNYRDRGMGEQFLKDNRSDIISRYGLTAYQNMASLQEEWSKGQSSNNSVVEEQLPNKNGFLKNFFQWAIPGGKKWGES